jgi:hypothetical protein
MTDNEQSQAPESEEEEGKGEGGFSEAFVERSADPTKRPENEPAEAGAAEASAEEEAPAVEAGAAEAPPKGAASEGSGTKPSGFDPFAGLTPEQKSHFERLQASERSNRGRVGALTKKVNQLVSGTSTAPPEKKPEDQGQARGDESGQGGKPDAADIEKRLKAVTDEYGDILGPLPDLVQDLRKEIDGLKASATRHEVDQDAKALEDAYANLAEAHPDFEEVAGKPEFNDWLGNQPKGVQALANSFDPQEVSLALTLFKTEAGTVTTPSGDRGEGGGTATGDRRTRQLDALRQPANRGAPAAAGVPNDFSAGFKQRAAAK